MPLHDQPQFRWVKETYAEVKARRERIEKALGWTIPPWPYELELKAEEDAARERRAG